MIASLYQVVQKALQVDGQKDRPLKVDGDIPGSNCRELARLERVRPPNIVESSGYDGEDG